MVLIGDEALLEARFGPFGDNANLEGKIGARFAPNVPKAQIAFRTYPMVLLGDEAQLEARFGPFRDSANLEARLVHGWR